MSVMNSAGVYDRIVDRSFIVNAGGLLAGGIVITSDKGPVDVTTVTSASQFERMYGLPSRDNPSMYAAFRFLRRAGILSVRRVTTDATAATGETASTALSFEAANPGTWGNDISITFEDAADEGTGMFYLIVHDDGVEVERFLVSRDMDARDGFGTNVYVEDRVNRSSMYIRVDDDPYIVAGVDFGETVTLSGGTNDTVSPSSSDIVTAWEDFENDGDVPAQLLINGGWAIPAVQTKMAQVAAIRGDAVAILDVPEADSDSVADMVTYVSGLGLNTNLAGIFGGWIRIYDQYQDREVLIPPSGDVAAVFNYTVTVGERWDAPAGVQRGIIPNALGVSKVFTQGDRDVLYSNRINPVTSYAGASAIVWGQRTLQLAASALNRFNVVNLILWGSARMKEALQPFVFQPNSEATRSSVNYLLSSFWENVKQRGGVYDFYVDTSTDINTPQVIDNNQMFVDVYIKPTKVAEMIRLSSIITPTGVNFR
jgi:hypothetical protein